MWFHQSPEFKFSGKRQEIRSLKSVDVSTRSAAKGVPESHGRQSVEDSDPFYKARLMAFGNPHGRQSVEDSHPFYKARLMAFGNPHGRQSVEDSHPFYEAMPMAFGNPTDGSPWMVQILSTKSGRYWDSQCY